jgi:hypothetical protein
MTAILDGKRVLGPKKEIIEVVELHIRIPEKPFIAGV